MAIPSGGSSIVADLGSSAGSFRAHDCAPAGCAQQLFAESYLGLVRLAAAALRDVDWAEDVVQDAFARIQTRLGQFSDRDQALAYLRRSVVNGARSELRRCGVRRRHSDLGGPENMPAAELTALDQLRRSHLLEAVARLPSRQRAVVLLRFVQDLSIADTAKALRISHGAVKASQRRAADSLSPSPKPGRASTTTACGRQERS